ncbi:MFS transporter [Streptomyces sp. NPDC056883]|uniref:MFS transporter n=1 Tax=Streptomyces sp. NPDC056883 TaxID=3345959 RepID=UPI00368A55FF
MDSTASTSPTATIRGRRLGILLVLAGAIFLEGIDVAMLNVALPSIRADLGLETGTLQWVMSAYVLGYGGFMLLGGRAADLFGRRRMFIGWLTVFLLFSGLGGLATEGWQLIAARFVTGVAAAFMTPAGLSIITTGFDEGPQREKALLVYSGTAAAGFSVGLVAGGLLASVGWRWVFFAPVALAALILAGALAFVPKAPKAPKTPEAASALRPERGRIDVWGGVLVTAGVVLLVLGVEEISVPAVLAGIALLGAFALVERRTAEPLVRLGILRSPGLLRANAAALLFSAAFFGFQFLVVLYLQEVRGWSTLQTSLAMLVIGIDAVLSPTVVPKLVARYGNGRLIFGGLLLAALAYGLFLPLGADWSYLVMLPSLVLLGLAFALVYGPLTIVATEGVAEEEQGLAGGLLYTAFQFGAALGLAAVTGVAAGAAEPLEGYRAALLVPFAAVLAAAAVTLPGLRRGSHRPGQGPVAVGAGHGDAAVGAHGDVDLGVGQGVDTAQHVRG